MTIRLTALVVVVLACVGLTGCSGGSTGHAWTSAPAPSRSPSGDPTTAGRVTAVSARSCPLLAASTVHGTLGQRLGRLTVLRSGDRTIGCRFYAQQRPDASCGPTCLAREDLPGADQPVLEIVTSRYRSADAARTAFIEASRTGTDGYTVNLAADVPGVVYRTAFVPGDRGRDWACAFAAGTTGVVLRSDENASDGGDLEVATLARAVLRGL